MYLRNLSRLFQNVTNELNDNGSSFVFCDNETELELFSLANTIKNLAISDATKLSDIKIEAINKNNQKEIREQLGWLDDLKWRLTMLEEKLKEK